MKKSSIKKEFGGELEFTKFLSQDKEASQRFLEAADISSEDYEITPEERTADGKRPDLIVREGDDIVAVVEAQDAAGWLDSNHASKIMYYMYDKRCDLGILLVEDAAEEIKGYIRYLNENTPANIFVLLVGVYENKQVDFYPLIRPFSGKKRIIKESGGGKTSTTSEYHPITEIFKSIIEESKKSEEYKNMFTTHTSRYLATQQLGNNNLNVRIHPRINGNHVVHLWHRGKYENHAEFEKAFTDFVEQELNLEVFRQLRERSSVKVNGIKNSLKVYKALVDAVKTGKFDFKCK